MKHPVDTQIPKSALRSIYIDLANRLDTLLRYCYNRNALALQKRYPQLELPLCDEDIYHISAVWSDKKQIISLGIGYRDSKSENQEQVILIAPEDFFCERSENDDGGNGEKK